ncbi:2-hydroxyacid dehydrogenase [Ilumatobacter nonamiensis]|uniref:2-hydroxyacid dehydrogenase n=1 Tax=Ilumatobacter nonamiensis TaxID=467093 RepID=UPI00034A9B35|nr:D-glycerate dehydrogenase [Ilumatobacter nonamiensis]
MNTSTSKNPPKIVVTGRIPEGGLDLLRSAGDVWAWSGDDPAPRDVVRDQLADAKAVVTLLSDQVDDDFLDAAPNARVVANVAVGYNNVDVDACTARGVRVTNTPGVLTEATADLAIGLLLASTRRLGEGERLIRSGAEWKWGMFMMLGTGLQGRQLGIVGMGEIGTATATRARAFGMDIVYHNRSAASAEVEQRLEARRLPLDDLLAGSDVVSLHCPYTAETHHLIDADALASMKSSAYLVNTARGPIVEEAALVDALGDGAIAGAALDVYEHEPDVHPGLLDLDNVVLAPHLGSATVETRTAMAELAARNVVAVLRGDDPPTPVN